MSTGYFFPEKLFIFSKRDNLKMYALSGSKNYEIMQGIRNDHIIT